MNRSHAIRSSAENSTESEDQSVAKKISQNPVSGNNAFQFTDNRPEAIAQRKLQQEAANSSRHNGLPARLKTGIEDLSGYSMDDVTVHYNSGKPAQLQAYAYAQGNHIHLGAGQEKHLPHEAWHVVQQKQGRVKPTLQLKHGGMVNTDAALEMEADRMGQCAMKQSSSADIARPVSMHKRITPGGLMIQCAWIRVDNKRRKWEWPIDGVTWFADNSGAMWFEITEESKVPAGRDYKSLEGADKKRSWARWNDISVRPTAEYNADVEYNESLETMDAKNPAPEWKKWENYINTTIEGAKEKDLEADVKKTKPGLDPSKVKTRSGKPLSAEQQETVRAYIADFKIVTKDEFNLKLWEMAEKLAKIKTYSCIISEPGKSNHWITARVLKRVRFLGGNAPQRIICVPAKEVGALEPMRQARLSDISLEGAGDIVFLDDGSFSGSQLSTLIEAILKNNSNNKRIGLVASSADAYKKIKVPMKNYLTTPILIKDFKNAEGLSDVYNAMEWNDLKKHGNHQLGFYTKIPDHQSVRTKLITEMQDSDKKTAITGYTESRLPQTLGNADAKNVPLNGTEPYKALHGTKVVEPVELHGFAGESKSTQPGFSKSSGGLTRYGGISTSQPRHTGFPVVDPEFDFLGGGMAGGGNSAGKSSQVSVRTSGKDLKLAAQKTPVAPDSKDRGSGAGDVIIAEKALTSFVKDQDKALLLAQNPIKGQTVTGPDSKIYELVSYNDVKKEFTFRVKVK